MKKVLVVDDEFANAEILALILEDEGYHVTCAANGRDGLRRVQESRPDLVVLDFMMPVLNGAEMGKALRAEPATRGIKILMNSALPEASVRLQFAGYDAYLRKPFRVEAALQLIGQLLEGDARGEQASG